MFGSPIRDPKFDYLERASGLKPISVLVGKYPAMFPVTIGANVRIFLGVDSNGDPSHTFAQVEDISDDWKTMAVRYLYEEAEAKSILARWHPRSKKQLNKLFPEKESKTKFSQEILLFSSNHRDNAIPIDSVDDIIQLESWYDYEFESHRQIFVVAHHLDVTTGTLHQLQPPSNVCERFFSIFFTVTLADFERFFLLGLICISMPAF